MDSSEIEKILKCKIGICPFEYVKNNLISCRNKEKIPKNAKSIIMFAFPYKVYNEPPLNICRYAAVPDYHKICGNILDEYCEKLKKVYSNNVFEKFIDNSPIPEVAAAAKAGLGVVGKNGLLITEKYGSFVFLGEIVTDLFIFSKGEVKYCLDCGICKQLCPVGLDKSRCLSALTQKKGELTTEEKILLKKSGCIWGCDICAENCPMNKNALKTYIKPFKDGYRKAYVKGEYISGRAFEWRGEKVIKRNFDILNDYM